MRIERVMVVRHTRNLEAMRQFYRDQLGFLALETWDEPGNRGIVLAVGEGAAFELLDMSDVPVTDEAPANTVVSIAVPDISAWYAHVNASGIEVAREIEDTPWGHRSFGIDDPEGLRIWFYQELRPSEAGE